MPRLCAGHTAHSCTHIFLLCRQRFLGLWAVCGDWRQQNLVLNFLGCAARRLWLLFFLCGALCHFFLNTHLIISSCGHPCAACPSLPAHLLRIPSPAQTTGPCRPVACPEKRDAKRGGCFRKGERFSAVCLPLFSSCTVRFIYMHHRYSPREKLGVYGVAVGTCNPSWLAF